MYQSADRSKRRAQVSGPEEEGLHPADRRSSVCGAGSQEAEPDLAADHRGRAHLRRHRMARRLLLDRDRLPRRVLGLLESRGRFRLDGGLADPAVPLAVTRPPGQTSMVVPWAATLFTLPFGN